MTHDLMLFGLAALVLLAGGFCIGYAIGHTRGHQDGYRFGRLMGGSAAITRQIRRRGQ